MLKKCLRADAWGIIEATAEYHGCPGILQAQIQVLASELRGIEHELNPMVGGRAAAALRRRRAADPAPLPHEQT